MEDLNPTWWVVDLPDQVRGANCLCCLVDGREVRARFQDRLGGPVCEAHFIGLVRAAAVFCRMEAMQPFVDKSLGQAWEEESCK